MGIELLYPYGHTHGRPPEPVELPARDRFDPAAMGDRDLVRAVDGLEGTQRWLDAVRFGIIGEYEHRGLHDRTGATSAATQLTARYGRDRVTPGG